MFIRFWSIRIFGVLGGFFIDVRWRGFIVSIDVCWGFERDFFCLGRGCVGVEY